MKKLKIGILSCFILLILVSHVAARGLGEKKEISPTSIQGNKNQNDEKTDGSIVENSLITMTGKVRRVGNEPFTELVLTDGEGKEWHLDEGAGKILAPYEQREVTVTASVRYRRMVLANGKELPPMGILYDLSLVK